MLFKKPGADVPSVEPVGVVGWWTGVDVSRLLSGGGGAETAENGKDVGGKCRGLPNVKTGSGTWLLGVGGPEACRTWSA